MYLLKRLVIAWKRYETQKFIFLIYKNINYYTKELVTGRIFQPNNKSKFDEKYGTNTDAIREIGSLDIAFSKNNLHANGYEPSPDHVVTKIFRGFSINHEHFIFLDFGCGKGRVLCMAGMLPFKAVIGIELSLELCGIAKNNISKIPSSNYKASLIECLHADVMEYKIPDDSLVCFFCNPFDQVIMDVVINKLSKSVIKNPRELYVIYLNPEHRTLFDNSEQWDVIYQSEPEVNHELEIFVIYRFCHQHNIIKTRKYREKPAETAEKVFV